MIADARRRQRRRRVALALLPLLAALAVLVTDGPPRPSQMQNANPPTRQFIPARDVLAKAPYLGVACTTPNSIACDRLGIWIQLKQPALSVTASLHGRSARLDDPAWSGPRRAGGRRVFAGFLRRAGLATIIRRADRRGRTWSGRGEPAIRLLLRIRSRHGQAFTRMRVPVAPGWG